METDVEGVLQEIRVDHVQPNPRQPRQLVNEEKIQELAASIREHGVVQPIVVRPLPGGTYELIAGERRWRACRALGQDLIPAIIRDYGDLEASAISLIENIQREDLNPLEEATAYRRLMDEFGLTQEEISKMVGKSRPFIANTLRLLALTDEVKELLSSGRISAGHARTLLSLEDIQAQTAAAREVVAQGMTVREAEELVRRLARPSPNLPASGTPRARLRDAVNDAELDTMESMLGGALGTGVRIRSRRGGGGVIEISYESKAQLEELINLLMQ